MPYFIVNRNAQPISGDHEVHNLFSAKGMNEHPVVTLPC